MSRYTRPLGLTIWPTLLILGWAAGCSRPDGFRSGDAAAQAGQRQVPLRGDANPPNSSSPDHSTPGANNGQKPEMGLPFRDSQNLPVGTLLTVRLTNPIAAENPGASGSFEGVVDDPVMVEGETLIPRGTSVEGRVESALASTVKRNRGYVRLTLDSVKLAGSDLPIQTSSLFVRGQTSEDQAAQGDASASVIHLESGRRLTFRLTEPVYVAGQRGLVGH